MKLSHYIIMNTTAIKLCVRQWAEEDRPCTSMFFSLFRQRDFSQPPQPFDLRSNSLTLGIAHASMALLSLTRDFPCLRRGTLWVFHEYRLHLSNKQAHCIRFARYFIPPHAPPILGRGCNRSSSSLFH